MPRPLSGALRVLLVNGSQAVLNALAAWLETTVGIRVVGQAISGSEAMAQVTALQPDVIVMDIRIPGVPIERSLMTIKGMKALCPDVRVIVMSHLGLDHKAIAGADEVDVWLAKDQVVSGLMPALAALFPGWTVESSI